MKTKKKQAGLRHALLTVLFMMAVMFTSIVFLRATPHIPLILGCAMAGLVAVPLGYSWDEILEGMISGITDSLEAILILLLIGTLIGTWIAAGTVPTLICYGLGLVSARSFLPASMLVCLLVAVAIGSWGTVGTIGLAVMGIGLTLGLPPALVAGSVISGAYMGEVISPLSDATNLAAGVVGENVLLVVKKTIPAALCAGALSLAVYTAVGLIPGPAPAASPAAVSEAGSPAVFSDDASEAGSPGEADSLPSGDAGPSASSGSDAVSESIQPLLEGLHAQFRISPLCLLPMAAIIICLLLRLPAIPSMLAGSLAGALTAVLLQGKGVGEVLSSACEGFVSTSGNEMIDRLLSAGGLQRMMETVSIILLAMAFGGIMRETGQMEALVRPITSRLRSEGSLSAAVVLTCILMNVVLPDQYLSLSLPGQVYGESFDRRSLSRARLGSVILGGGAVTSPLIPWNTCGIYCSTILSAAPHDYAPFVFFGLLLPVTTVLFSFIRSRTVPSRAENTR